MMIRRCVSRLAVLGVVLVFPLASAAQPGGASGGRSEVSLVAESDALVPGETAMLGLRFEVPDAWHIYQPSQNDTGLEPMAEWASDGGLSFGSIRWPAGHRFTQPGEILDHGYEGTVLLVIPVEVPSSLDVGSTVSVSASVDWLECDAELCVPGSADVSIELPVRGSAERGPQAAAFDAAEKAMGSLLGGDGSDPVTIAWDEQTMVVTAAAGPALHLSFVPAEGCSRIEGLFDAGASATGELRLRFEDVEGDVVGWIRVSEGGSGGNAKSDASGVWRVRTRIGGGS
ncbi:MAG: protein-disulfide reductase DsbD domain-containing protein [Planctomycetota bacterium]